MEFQILGSLEAMEGGASVPLGAGKQRALLALLLLNANRTVSLDELVDQLWGVELPARAVKVLQTYVSRLRKVLPDGMLRTRPPGYVLLLEPGELDLQRFEGLASEGRSALAEGDAKGASTAFREALSLWRGPALAEFTTEPFARSEGTRLEELRLSALEDRIEADLALGHQAAVVGELESLVSHHPLRERFRGQLMLALYRAGRQAEALATYQAARRDLVEELGIEPSRSLQELERAILRQELSLELAPPAALTKSDTLASAPAKDALGGFVGRGRELGRLLDALESSLDGSGRLVLLVGESGIGKTRTAQELAARAVERGAGVLWGRCYEREGAPPYWPWVQALRPYVTSCDPARLAAELGAGAALIAAVVPEINERVPKIEPPPRFSDQKQARFRLLDSLASFLANAAESRAFVLVLDDLHAADRGSLMLLELVARGLARSRVLLLGTYRDAELTRGHPLSDTLAELTRDQLCERVALAGLTEGDVAELLEQALGAAPPDELVCVVHEQTEGNPLFVSEVVRLLGQEGKLGREALATRTDWRVGVPEGIRDVIGRRFDRLSPRCNELLRLASVIGREFALGQLEQLLPELTESELLDAVEEALAAQLVQELPGGVDRYQFTHALIRETLAGELSTTRRVRLQARIAEALEELYGDRAERHADELAYHFAEAETVLGPERVIHYSRIAGEQAYAAHAYEDAIAHFERALAAREGQPMDGETAELLFWLARSEFAGRQRYDLDQALSRVQRAFEYYVTIGDTARAVAVAAHPIPPVWGETEVPALISQALAMVPPDSPEAGQLLITAGRFAGTNQGDYAAASQAFGRALAIARRNGDAALERTGLALAARVDWWHLRWQECVAKCKRALELALTDDDQQTEMAVRSWLARNAAIWGDSAEARLHAAIALELADRLRERYWLATTRVNSFWLEYLAGRWEAARQLSNAVLRVQPRDARNLALRTLLEYQLGEFATGDAYLEQLIEAMQLTDAGSTVEHSEAAATIALAGRIAGRPDRFEQAEDAARTVLSALIRIPIFDLYARIGLGVIAVERHDREAAREQYQALASQRGTMLILLGIAADRLLGLLADRTGEQETACSHFEDALALCEQAGYRPEQAWTASDYAGTLLKRALPGDRERATTLRDEALRIAVELGMHGLTERIHADQQTLKA